MAYDASVDIHMRMHRTTVAHLPGTPLETLADHLIAIEEVCRAGEVYEERAVHGWYIQHTVSGSAEVRVDGVPYRHRPGSLLVLAPHARVAERVRESWHLRYLILGGCWPELLRPALAGHRALMLPDPPRAWTAALDGGIEEIHSGRTGWPWRVAGELSTLLGGLALLRAGPAEGDLPTRIGHLVDADPSRTWDVLAVAQALRMAPRTLQARFRKEAPQGVARWVLERRLEHARLLLDRGLPVGAVADRLGFANPYHFSRVCRRVHGAPPSALRRG